MRIWPSVIISFLFSLCFALSAQPLEHSEAIPFEKRVEIADLVFTGRVISDEPMKSPMPAYDTVAKFEVGGLLKGKISGGQPVEIHYVSRKPDLNLGEAGEDNNPGRLDRYSRIIDKNLTLLVFAKKVDGAYFTSWELRGGDIQLDNVKAEVEKLRKLRLTQSWWKRLFGG